jgi:hypothetical protein
MESTEQIGMIDVFDFCDGKDVPMQAMCTQPGRRGAGE